MGAMMAMCRARFPRSQNMSTEDLQQLTEDQQQEVVILDVRSRDEDTEVLDSHKSFCSSMAAKVPSTWRDSYRRWANEGRKVYRGEVEVSPTLVHPYNFTFGQVGRDSNSLAANF
eukprot:766086-Hanusia_phi.AAC.2